MLVKAFKPSLEVQFIAALLGFTSRQQGSSGGGGGGEAGNNGEAGGGAAAAPLPGCSQAVYEGEFAALPEADGEAACAEWLQECGAALSGGGGGEDGGGDEGLPALVLDCRASVGQLRMPEEKEKVAHGDANLAIDDFLKGFS